MYMRLCRRALIEHHDGSASGGLEIRQFTACVRPRRCLPVRQSRIVSCTEPSLVVPAPTGHPLRRVCRSQPISGIYPRLTVVTTSSVSVTTFFAADQSAGKINNGRPVRRGSKRSYCMSPVRRHLMNTDGGSSRRGEIETTRCCVSSGICAGSRQQTVYDNNRNSYLHSSSAHECCALDRISACTCTQNSTLFQAYGLYTG